MPQEKIKDLVIIIPARYKSTRFPGKPLVDILGKSMIRRVWEVCVQVLPSDCIYVATDDKRIYEHCKTHNINSVMTSRKCLTGTDRVIEVSKKISAKNYINVQGDEPVISCNDIKKFIINIKKYPNKILNGVTRITNKKDYKKNSIPKVVFNKQNELIYMSRSVIPGSKRKEFKNGYRQVCIYSFPKKVLNNKKFYNKKTPLEYIEDIEILRFIEHGEKVQMIEVSNSSIAVDYPSDLLRVKRFINAK